MKRLFPSPILSLVLFIVWLLLNGSASAGQVALGILFATLIPRFTDDFRPERPRLRKPAVLFRLLGVVLWDVVQSNLTVARQVLGRESKLRSRFVWVPLQIRDSHGIAALASIITMTPGTLSADLTEDRLHLLVHALHVEDEAALIACIQARYETPLMEIFGC
ncbi:Na+/H+ antiporter subunit E [Chitinimonas sp. PSY-7]|uniref:Na+/H+ antiporter subunit E n=1 Tax=Chitinimonas sp. PSY-7 TaxID=3459088 RepID=UPI00403FF053